MKGSKVAVLTVIACASKAKAFVPSLKSQPYTVLNGYLDDLTDDLYKESAVPDVQGDKREANKMAKNEVDRFGPGNLKDFVDFDEFDGGDGQQGVAGDGQTGLDKSDFNTGELATSRKARDMSKSVNRSAKNAWGTTSTGYAEQLIEEKGMDITRAQQLENWANQREIHMKAQDRNAMAESFDSPDNAEVDWRTLGKFGVERNEDTNLDEEFGAVVAGDITGTIEFNIGTGAVQVKDLAVDNEYMGFADFRASFTPDTPGCYQLEPTEGSLQKGNPTNFVIRFRPESMGTFNGALVIETEDFKKTWYLIGTTG